LVEIDAVALQTEDLSRIGELQVPPQLRTGPDAAGLDPPMAFGGFTVLRGEKLPAGGLRCPAGGWVDCP
jgi:hypothetical protein